MRYDLFSLAAEFIMDVVNPHDLAAEFIMDLVNPHDADDSAGRKTPRQWTFDVAPGLSF